jgi:pimeloyl-ACP methyl ester carboxylesterase
MSEVISRDGTPLAFQRTGSGPPIVIVDGALCSRTFRPSPKLAERLSRQFTVYAYDRRGRGASGDTQPYAKEREIEDIAALIETAGGSAILLGLSSGAVLAMEAAASGLNIAGLVAYEPPFMVDDARAHARANHEAHLRQFIASGERGRAVRYFMRDMVGAPALVVALMRFMPGVWPKLTGVAHTLPYDAAIMGDWSLPVRRLISIQTPTLVIDGEKTDRRLRRATEEVVKIIPGARRSTLEGQTHNVSADALAPAVASFFIGGNLACAA